MTIPAWCLLGLLTSQQSWLLIMHYPKQFIYDVLLTEACNFVHGLLRLQSILRFML